MTQARAPFGVRVTEAMDEHGPLCVGLDPHPRLLDLWGLPDSPDGLRAFSDAVLDAVEGRVAAVKPQAAFFERHGAAGVAVLESVLQRLEGSGTVSILDAKRGDIGSTMEAYAAAYLADGAPMAVDALTVSPYLGYGSLQPALDLARSTGRGVFVLALTSNPEGAQVQHAGDPTVAARVVAAAGADNAGTDPVGHVGLVIGATVGSAPADLGLDLVAANAVLLTPGVGAQGGTANDLARTFAGVRARVLAPVGRALLQDGPSGPSLRAAADRLAEELARALGK